GEYYQSARDYEYRGVFLRNRRVFRRRRKRAGIYRSCTEGTRFSALGKKRWQECKNHHKCGECDANTDECAELAEAGETAEVQDKKGADGCGRCPENAGSDGTTDFGHGQIGMREGFLIVHNGVIHGEAEKNRCEAHTDDVNVA